MKSSFRLPLLVLGLLPALVAPAHAGSTSFVTNLSNYYGTGTQYWNNVFIPATCSVSVQVQVTVGTNGGGGGNSVSRGGAYVTSTSIGGPGPGTYTSSNSATAQPSGYYKIDHGWAGGPVSPYITTTFTW